MQYGRETGYTPPTDMRIEINPDIQSPSYCDDLTTPIMNCSFVTTSKTTYNVAVILNNSVGMTFSNRVSFHCKFEKKLYKDILFSSK